MKKYILGIAAFAALMTGCSKDDEATNTPSGDGVLYTEMGASVAQTRTTLGSGNSVIWSLNDQVSLWSDEVSSPQTFTLIEGAGTNTAKFKTTSTGVSGTTFYSVYPTTMLQSTNTMVLPSTQTYQDVANFATNTNPSAAVGSDIMNMQFKNLCGIVVVELSADADAVATVNSIVLTSATPLAGKSTLSFESGSPVLTCDGTSTLTLNCGVTLTTTPMAFYFVVPAATYDNGMDITVNASIRGAGTLTLTKSRTSSFTVNAGEITKIGASFVLGTKTYAVGDLYEANGMKGIVFEVSNSGRSGKFVAMNDCSVDGTSVTDEVGTYYYYTWGLTTVPTQLPSSTTDGAANMAVMEANDPGLSNYPAFKAVADLGDGWYLPASTELAAFISNGEISSALLSNGGEDMLGVAYWSSTLTGSARLRTIYYYDGVTTGAMQTVSLANQSQVQGSVRAIAQF